jgi:hypothetical protein
MVNDFLVDEDGDELILNGDYAVGPSDSQHIDDIIISVAGAWREFPAVGVGIQEYQSGPPQEQKLRSIVNQQLQADGYANVLAFIDYVNNELNLSVEGERTLMALPGTTPVSGGATIGTPSFVAGNISTQVVTVVGPPGQPGPAGPAGPAGPSITDEQVIALSLLFG